MPIRAKIWKPSFSLLVCTILLFVSSDSFAADCNPDEISLTTQAEVDAFQLNHGPCDTVVGGLEIRGSDISSLRPLSDLIVVNGFLNIQNTIIQSLDGISSLENVGEWFQIAQNPFLLDLDEFPNIFHLSLNLLANNNLQNIDGLSQFSGEIARLALQSNPQLHDIDGLLGITGIAGHLIITHMTLADFHGLSNLVYVNEHVIIDGDTHLSLDGLENLTTIGSFLVLGSSQPIAFSNSQLENLDGLSGLTHIGSSLLIGHHPNLVNIDGLSKLETIGANFIVVWTDLLTDLNALSGVTTWGGGVRLEYNKVLSDISVLSNIPASIPYLTLSLNPALTDLSPLSHLTELQGRLFIAGAGFTDASPLAGIQGVDGDFVLRHSSSIENCEVFQTLLDQVDDFEPGPGPNSTGIPDVSGEIEIHSNAPGCNSLDDIAGPFLKSSFED